VKQEGWLGLSRRKQILLAFLLFYSIAHLGYSLCRYGVFSGSGSGDFYRSLFEVLYWGRGEALTGGVPLHPPLYYLIFTGLTNFDFQHLAYIFYFSQFIFYYFSIIFLAKSVSAIPSIVEYLIAAILALNFQPFLETCALHKIEGHEFFLICLAIYMFKKRRDLWVGGIIVCATGLKYLPGILAPYFLLKREYKVIAGAVLASLILLLMVLSTFGIDEIKSYAVELPLGMLLAHKHEGNLPDATTERQTLDGTINRLLARPDPSQTFISYIQKEAPMSVPNPRLAHTISAFLKLTLIGGYLFIIRKKWTLTQRENVWDFYLFEISLTLIMIFVVAQGSRVHYAILLLPAFILTGLILYRHWEVFHLREKVLFALAYSLAGMVVPGGLLNKLPPHPAWGQRYSDLYLWWSLPFYGYLILGVCIVLCYERLYRLRYMRSLIETETHSLKEFFTRMTSMLPRRNLVLKVFTIGFLSWLIILPAKYRQMPHNRLAHREAPLSIRALEFCLRDYQCRRLAWEVTQGFVLDEDRTVAILNWTREHIRPVPQRWPVKEDHVLNLIVRGYATDSQMADVFTTLCTYAGTPAFWRNIQSKEKNAHQITLSFVRMNGRWTVWDVARGAAFKDEQDHLLDVAQLAQNPKIARRVIGKTAISLTVYQRCLQDGLTPFEIPQTLPVYKQILGRRVLSEIERTKQNLWRS